ncbi:MAG: prephenate dehydratase [Acidimicrobiia bacterium]
MTLAYFGPPGTFTEEAVRSQPDLARIERVPYRSIPDVLAAVESGEADLGMVPLENSIEGSVTVTLDTLAFESDLLIQREVDLPIALVLCARSGTELSDISRLLAFPHASAQCRRWLANKLPDAELAAANSNADAAREVSRSRRAGVAAIANAFAAELYGLDVLATEIEDHPENQTRFVLLGRGIPAPTGHDKTSIVCFQREDKPGSLLAILSEFASRAINLTKLESRPTKQSLGDYCFVIDFEGHVADELTSDCLRTLTAKQANVKFLGSYPVAGEEEAHAKRRAHGRAWKQAGAWIDDLRAQIRAPEAHA